MTTQTETKPQGSKDDTFYGPRRSEVYHHRSLADALRGEIGKHYCRSDMPEILVMSEMRRMEVRRSALFDPLENVIELLEETYGSEYFERDCITPAMREAERAFMEVVYAEYIPFQVEESRRFCVILAQPSAECCTFQTGCCEDRSAEPCALHSCVERCEDCWLPDFS